MLESQGARLVSESLLGPQFTSALLRAGNFSRSSQISGAGTRHNIGFDASHFLVDLPIAARVNNNFCGVCRFRHGLIDRSIEIRRVYVPLHSVSSV